MSKKQTAILIATGKPVDIYKSSQRNTYINWNDLETEYKPEELKFK